MAKKKKTSILAFWAPKKKKKKTKAQIRASKEANIKRVRVFSVIFAVGLTAAAVCVGFFYLEKYVKRVSPVAQTEGPLFFPHDNVPEWFNEELAGLMRESAGIGPFLLNEDSAKLVGDRLKSLEWIEDLRVQTTKDSLRVTAKYHKPIASFKLGRRKFCIAINGKDDSGDKLIAMRHLNITKLPIVEITGSRLKSIKDIGIQRDIIAAVKIIELLATMDGEIKPAPPLLEQIESIDVSNFYNSNSEPKIVLYTKKEHKPIKWGNELGRTTGNIEATDEEKLGALYEEYVRDKKNSLLNRDFQFIDLRRIR